jgi:hypothetical protein
MNEPPSYALPLLLGLGVFGGIAIAQMAHEHLFVVGLEPEERKNLLYVAGAALLAGGAIYVLGIDRKWILADEAARALWEKYGP